MNTVMIKAISHPLFSPVKQNKKDKNSWVPGEKTENKYLGVIRTVIWLAAIESAVTRAIRPSVLLA